MLSAAWIRWVEVRRLRAISCNAFCMEGYPSYPSSAANRTTVDSLTSVSLPSLLAVMKAAWS